MSDLGYIKVNKERSDEHADRIDKTVEIFRARSLDPRDDGTTLCANANLHAAFVTAQSLVNSLGAALDKEATNIRSLGADFEQCDNELAGMGSFNV